MVWREIRNYYPEKWLLIEAVKAHSEGGRRILEQLSVVGAFSDSTKALERYREFHHADPVREPYVFHTSRTELDVAERAWLGIRAAS